MWKMHLCNVLLQGSPKSRLGPTQGIVHLVVSSLLCSHSFAHFGLQWECGHLTSVGLWGCPFKVEEELRAHPLNTNPSTAPLKSSCGLCGSTNKRLEVTECCGETLCNNEEEYVLMSYSRDFRSRSHGRYTMCGFHFNEGFARDWRECTQCQKVERPLVLQQRL